MGAYCEAKGFYRKKVGMCGSVVQPEVDTSKEVYCEKGNSVAEKKFLYRGFSSNHSERGVLHTTWDVVEVKCLKCLTTGIVSENYEEKDTTYHSNEEYRVFPEMR